METEWEWTGGLVEEWVGPEGRRLADLLSRCPPVPLSVVEERSGEVELGPRRLREVMAALISGGWVSVSEERGRPTYSLRRQAAVERAVLPTALVEAKATAGGAGQALLLVLAARRTATLDGLHDGGLKSGFSHQDLTDALKALAAAKLIRPTKQSLQNLPQKSASNEVFEWRQGSPPRAGTKRKLPEGPQEEEWEVHYPALDTQFREAELRELLKTYSEDEESVALVAEALVKLAAEKSEGEGLESVSKAVRFTEVWRSVAEKLSREEASEALEALAEASGGVVMGQGDAGSSAIYSIDQRKAWEAIAESEVRSVVRERYGPRAVRVFGLLRRKKWLEMNAVETGAMLPSKEGKELIHQLREDGVLSLGVVPRMGDLAPAKLIYLVGVRLEGLAKEGRREAWLGLCRATERRRAEERTARGLAEKELRAEAIAATIRADEALTEEEREEQVADVLALHLPPQDKAALAAARLRIVQLHRLAALLTRSFRRLHTFLQYLDLSR